MSIYSRLQLLNYRAMKGNWNGADPFHFTSHSVKKALGLGASRCDLLFVFI